MRASSSASFACARSRSFFWTSKVLAQHEIEAVEPRHKQRAQVLLHVLRGRVAQRFIDTAAQVVEKLRVDHDPKVPHRARAHTAANAPRQCLLRLLSI